MHQEVRFCFGSEEIRIRFCRLVNVGRLRVLSFLRLYAWGGGGCTVLRDKLLVSSGLT